MNYLIVGLGNPGDRYVYTRHNIGQLVLATILKDELIGPLASPWQKRDDLSAKLATVQVGSVSLTFLFPETYMNLSGASVAKAMKKEKIDNLVVVHDDLALPLGSVRLSLSRGDGGHNGVKSIVEAVGHRDFLRLRLGIAYQPNGFLAKLFKPSRGGKDFVLGKFSQKELEIIRGLEKTTTDILLSLIESGPEKTMNRFN